VLLPDEYFLGVAFKPIKKLSIEFDAILTRWNTFNHMTINFDKGIAGMNGVTKQKDWHDVWRYQIGVEYALTPIVDLRLGYTYDNEPIPARGVDFLFHPMTGSFSAAASACTWGSTGQLISPIPICSLKTGTTKSASLMACPRAESTMEIATSSGWGSGINFSEAFIVPCLCSDLKHGQGTIILLTACRKSQPGIFQKPGDYSSSGYLKIFP
jgi:hypothetical protein